MQDDLRRINVDRKEIPASVDQRCSRDKVRFREEGTSMSCQSGVLSKQQNFDDVGGRWVRNTALDLWALLNASKKFLTGFKRTPGTPQFENFLRMGCLDESYYLGLCKIICSAEADN